MANNYTQFSFAVGNLTPEESSWLTVMHRLLEEDDDNIYAFAMSIEPPEVVFYAAESGDVEKVANFVRAFLLQFRPLDAVGFEWATWCDKPRPDEFGGGAVLVTATRIEYTGTNEELLRMQATHAGIETNGRQKHG